MARFTVKRDLDGTYYVADRYGNSLDFALDRAEAQRIAALYNRVEHIAHDRANGRESLEARRGTR